MQKKHKYYLILFSVSLVLAYELYFLVNKPNVEFGLNFHKEIINGDALSPYRFRILVPFLIDPFFKLFSLIFTPEKSFLISYGLYDLFGFYLLLFVLFKYLKLWFTDEQSLIGCLFVSCTMFMGLKHFGFQSWTLLEATFYSFALLFMYKEKYISLGIVILLASLTRETAVFLPLIYFFVNIKNFNKTHLMRTIVYFTIWGIVYFGLRMILGTTEHIISFAELWKVNSSNIKLILLNNILFFGAFWLFAIFDIKDSPEFIKKITLIIPFYLITILIWGIWYEVRLWMPMYPILLPPALNYIYKK